MPPPLCRRGAALREPAGRRRAPRGRQAALAAGLPCPPPTGLAAGGERRAAALARVRAAALALRPAAASLCLAPLLRGPQVRWPPRVGRPRCPAGRAGPRPPRAPGAPPACGPGQAAEQSRGAFPLPSLSVSMASGAHGSGALGVVLFIFVEFCRNLPKIVEKCRKIPKMQTKFC